MRRPGRVHPLKVGLDHLHDYLSQLDIETGSPHAASAGVPNTSPNYAYLPNLRLAAPGAKDNISQVVLRCPYSGRTPIIQARHANFSNVGAIAVRVLSYTSMGVMSDFLDGRSRL